MRQHVAGENDRAAHDAQHQREGLLVRIAEALVELVRNAAHRLLYLFGAGDLFGVFEEGAGPVVVKFLHGYSTKKETR
ncbi:hypothetical protein GCM10027320_09660 [Massilia solisilvae]